MSGRKTVVFFVLIKGWSPNAIEQWRGPYQAVHTAQAQATKMTRRKDGSPYGDWTASIYRLDPDSLTLVEVT